MARTFQVRHLSAAFVASCCLFASGCVDWDGGAPAGDYVARVTGEGSSQDEGVEISDVWCDVLLNDGERLDSGIHVSVGGRLRALERQRIVIDVRVTVGEDSGTAEEIIKSAEVKPGILHHWEAFGALHSDHRWNGEEDVSECQAIVRADKKP